jgi:predicted alpha/beta-hydrolase family hydrolase
MSEFLFNGPKTAAITLVRAHDAGGPMDSPFMQTVAEGIAKSGVRVARFQFPYMQRQRETGRDGAPDPGPALMQSWHDAVRARGSCRALAIRLANPRKSANTSSRVRFESSGSRMATIRSGRAHARAARKRKISRKRSPT